MEKNWYLIIISLALLIISLVINLNDWIYDYYFFGYNIYSKKISIKPTLISSIIALLLFGGFITRNLEEMMNDHLIQLFFVLDLVFFSGFISLFSNGETNILGFSSQSLLFVIVILMWLGLRSLLRYVLLAFIICSIFFISQVNEAMGIYGALYIICAFFSFLIQVYQEILPKVEINEKDYLGLKENNESNENYYQRYNDQYYY